MTEATPVLPYRMTEYGRRPIFVVLAILLIVFGAISFFASTLSIFEMFAQLRIRTPQKLWPLLLSSILNSALSMASFICLIAAGIAFLIRSKHVAMLLWAYFLVMLGSALLSPALQTWTRLSSSTSPNDALHTALYSMVTLPRAIVDIVLLMLLRTPAVREIIRNVTGIQDSL